MSTHVNVCPDVSECAKESVGVCVRRNEMSRQSQKDLDLFLCRSIFPPTRVKRVVKVSRPSGVYYGPNVDGDPFLTS